MRVLLIVPRYSASWGEYYQIPLGLGYVASAMKKAGHIVTCLNLNHYHGTIEELIAARVAEDNPDICASGSLAPFLSILQAIFTAARKAKPGIVNIAGGGMASGEPEMSLRVMDIDIAVISEGEQTIVELLDCLEKSKNLHEINGIVFRDSGGKIVQTPAREQVRDLGQLAWPDYELLECDKNLVNQRALDSYFFHSQPESRPRAIDMITSRSCPFSCTFCFHPVGKVYRERPLDDFFAELDMVVARYKINMVALIDELFSLRKQRLLEFCERIKPYGLKWMVQLHVSSATPETIQAMSEAGCTYISYGIESLSPPILESMKKKAKPERIDSALAMTYENHIGIQGNLLFGDKAETLDTANESMHWWAYNRRYQINLTPLMVFPGSPDYYQALEDGLIVDREVYVKNIPSDFNISLMNDKNLEMMRFQLWVFANTLLNLAPLRTFKLADVQVQDRNATYDIVWDCPNCAHQNDYLGIILPPENSRSLRLSCRKCLSRWDVENKAYRPPLHTISEARKSFLRRATALYGKIRQRQYRAIATKLLSMVLGRFPALLRKKTVSHHMVSPEHMLKSFGVALCSNPFNPELHNDFAEALIKVGAHGAARMHYQQALALQPDNGRAWAGKDFVDSYDVSDGQRGTYFVSWSDEPPPARKNSATLTQHAQKITVHPVSIPG
jgi:anaerobic magnesium-protoporphyrin IX monomethyl ester cyclase